MNDHDGASPEPFRYRDKGQMATIGRKRAVLQMGKLEMSGFPAWVAWLLVHVYSLVGFKNRLFVVIQWTWAYLSFRRGARLIVDREWRDHIDAQPDTHAEKHVETHVGDPALPGPESRRIPRN